jgi:outer membrane lipoprotein-sorting protein
MRRSLSMLLLSFLAVAAARAQTADELVEKNLAARGGKARIKAVQAVRMSGKVNLAGGLEAPIQLELKRPGKVRMELTLQNQAMVQAYDGKSGWVLAPTGGAAPQPMPEDQLRGMKEQGDMDGVLVDYREKGSRVELVGKEDLGGAPAYKLKLIRKDGEVSFLYLDAASFLERKTVNLRRVAGHEVETELVLSDYKSAAGVLYPRSMEMATRDAGSGEKRSGMTMTFDKIEVDPDLPASRFELPEPLAPKEGAASPKRP